MFTIDFLTDLAERALKTFVQATIAVMLAGGLDLFDVTTLRTAAVGGIAAALSVISSALSSQVGDRGTAALLPAEDDPPSV